MVSVRELAQKDAPEVHAFIQSIPEFIVQSGDAWSEHELGGWLAEPSDCCVGAFDEGRLIGVCLTHRHEAANKVHVENLAVSEPYRRRGVASLLLSAIRASYPATGETRRLVAMVDPNNEPARGCFMKNGFLIAATMLWVQGS